MITEFSKPVKAIQNELKKYIVKNNIKSLVIGVSGGIDSAMCCVLANPVCRETGIYLIGRSISIESNSEAEIRRAGNIGNAFCTDFKGVDLTGYYKDFIGMFSMEEEKDDEYTRRVRNGNIKARMRMIYLYDCAQRNKGMVLSTDNRTELMVGFWTLHGDVGDYGMIQNLWKSEVYAMAEYLAEMYQKDSAKCAAIKECIDAVPTDGLGITDSDLDQLHVLSYQEADNILIDYIDNGNKEYEDHPIIKRYKNTMYKRDNPYNIPREKFL